MRPIVFVTAAFAALAVAPLTGCVTDEPKGGAPMPLVNAAGHSVGTVRAWQTAGGVTFRLDAAGLPHGNHAVHVHTVGRCDPPDFASAGPHWNPTNRQHGSRNPAGPHAGDLPNLLVGTDGRGSFEFTIPSAGLSNGGRRLMDADGASIVLHARPDDYRTDPSGNSGARIACGVLS